MKHLLPLAALALLALPAAADPMIVFSVSGITLNTSNDHLWAIDTPISVTGIDTPQHSGSTIRTWGFNWNPPFVASTGGQWSFGATDIILEGPFDFSGQSTLQPGDIGVFAYAGVGETSGLTVSMSGGTLEFSVQTQVAIDPRVAAYYGLAPPCLVAPLSPSAAYSCSGGPIYADALFTGTGTPIAGEPGVYTLSGEIDPILTPELGAVYLLATVALAMVAIAASRRASPSHRARAS